MKSLVTLSLINPVSLYSTTVFLSPSPLCFLFLLFLLRQLFMCHSSHPQTKLLSHPLVLTTFPLLRSLPSDLPSSLLVLLFTSPSYQHSPSLCTLRFLCPASSQDLKHTRHTLTAANPDCLHCSASVHSSARRPRDSLLP